MSKVKKVSVALTHDIAQSVQDAVNSGEYGSNSEVVRDALRDWQDKRERRAAEIEYLRRMWDEGIKSGPGRHTSIEGIIAEAKAQKCQS